MDPERFDSISRLFAERRLSRRRALRQGGAGGLAAGLLGMVGLSAAAQGTPEATPGVPEEELATFMFVQSFADGSLEPQAGEPDRYTMTLRRGLDQTIYFSDRPDRIFGLVPTEQFLNGLGFTPENPPNAALVGHQGPGRADLIVLELFDPHYDASSETLTYQVQVLQDTRQSPLHVTSTPVTELEQGRHYGASSLFIDDCANGTYHCAPAGVDCQQNVIGDITIGCCWDWSSLSCNPCGDLASRCNSTYPQCNGNCQACTCECKSGAVGCLGAG